jgi:hypothetical protein
VPVEEHNMHIDMSRSANDWLTIVYDSKWNDSEDCIVMIEPEIELDDEHLGYLSSVVEAWYLIANNGGFGGMIEGVSTSRVERNIGILVSRKRCSEQNMRTALETLRRCVQSILRRAKIKSGRMHVQQVPYLVD